MEFILPLILGISAGWLGSVYIEYFLAPQRAELQLSMAANIAAAQSKNTTDNGLADFLSANPFSISAYPVNTSDMPVAAPKEEIKAEVKNSFTTASLAWTIPEIGAWMRDNTNNKTDFVTIGENFEAYTLTEVLYDRAIFRDEENNNITKFFYLIDNNATVDMHAVAVPQPAAIPQPVVNQITAATPDQPGVISKEDVNSLMNNPFEEMKRFRMRPKFEGSEPIGIEIQWIQNDSILGKLGVQKGDVLKSVNGIPMKNMGDITNAINSLMNGTRFDVEVLRGNAPTNLTYLVR
jgi:hypothetical protein